MCKKLLLTLAFISPIVVISIKNVQAMEGPEHETWNSCMDKCNKTFSTVREACESIKAQEAYRKCFDDAIAVQEACHSKCNEKYKNRNK